MNEIPTLTICNRCEGTYSWAKSTSSLRLTYCSILCEVADIGFHIPTFIKSELERDKDIPNDKKEEERVLCQV